MDVELVVDDFGTGYSSLAYLQRLQTASPWPVAGAPSAAPSRGGRKDIH